MKVAILGASGVIGQHLMISVPPGVEAVFTRRRGSGLYEGLDLSNRGEPIEFLDEHAPSIVINLIGENRPDVVQAHPLKFQRVNVVAPKIIADWCDAHGQYLIHVSSQAVLDPINFYGGEKLDADHAVRQHKNWTIIRPTFVLGIRPFPAIGRENPAERILAGRETHSVDNRYFAVSFAWDVAELLWRIAQDPEKYRGQEINAGNPERLSRWELARMLGANPEPITQEHAEKVWGIAPRPMDTSGAYTEGWHDHPLDLGIETLKSWYANRSFMPELEIAAFLRTDNYGGVFGKLAKGFGPLHNAVTEDFNHSVKRFITRTGVAVGTKIGAPANDAELLEWYRTTDSYIYELSAYHCDPGFNYAGMCKGILQTLLARMNEAYLGEMSVGIWPVYRVLCLGDGVGSLTIALMDGGLEPVYHDLAGSRTAAFAAARFEMRFADSVEQLLSTDFNPPAGPMPDSLDRSFDAVVSLDFLEHVTNVEDWVRFIWKVLKVEGVFCAQNAFGMGSGPDGAMPMHLACNDRFEKDWDPLLAKIGFRQIASNWYEKPALPASVMQADSVPAHRVAEWPTE